MATGQEGGGSDAEARTLLAVVGLAQMQVAAQLQTADSDDGKAIGLVAVDVTLAAALVAARLANARLPGLWWLPLLGFAVAAAWALASLAPRQFDAGPDPEALYGIIGPMVEAEALRNLLGALEETIQRNAKLLSGEAHLFYRGLWWLLGTVVLGAGFLLAVGVVR